jgi:hypothetical protein
MTLQSNINSREFAQHFHWSFVCYESAKTHSGSINDFVDLMMILLNLDGDQTVYSAHVCD